MDYIDDKFKDLPRDMHLSIIEFSDSRCSNSHRRCELCLHPRKKFHCASCIREGDFYHSSLFYCEKFSELKARLIRARRESSRARDRCFVRLEATLAHRGGNLFAEINQRAEIARLLKAAVEQRKEVINKLKTRQRVCRPPSPPVPSLLPSPSHTPVVESELKQITDELNSLRRTRVRQLVQYIFPDCGKLSIPSRPVNNDESVDCLSILQTSHANAEMCLAAQLIALISHYLDIRLPFPIDFSEYGTAAGSDEERHHRLCACAATVLRAKGLPPPSSFTNNVLTSLSDIVTVIDDRVHGRCPGFCGTDCPHCLAWDDWAADWAGWTNWTDPVAEKVESTDQEDEWENVGETATVPAMSPVGRQTSALGTSLVSEAAASLVSIWRGWTAK